MSLLQVVLLRGGEKHDRTVSNASFSSLAGQEDSLGPWRVEDESAYGGSGRSSLVSTLDRRQERDRQLESVTLQGETATQSGSSGDNVGLMMKMQAALKEAHRDKEALERKLEEMETGGRTGKQMSQDTLKLQDLEMENVKLREDMTRLRQHVAENSEDGGSEAAREMVEQFEALQEELDRVKMECQQLKTILANVQLSGSLEDAQAGPSSLLPGDFPEADELLMAYETQKKVIQQLQASLGQERERAGKVEREARQELERLGSQNREQQAVIQTNMNKSPSNQTEAYMQHELTRLTGENFDLREKIENLNDTAKRLKRQLKVYMKKLQESGVVHSVVEEVGEGEQGGETDQTLPVILKKEADYLGMLEYKQDQEEKLLKTIITELKPRVASQMLPGLPAYILFMLIRHLDHINDDKNVRSLIQGGIGHIKKTIKKRGQTDIELKTLWLSNTLRLLHCLKQYSGETQFQTQSTAKQVEHCLRNFDLSAYRRVLSDIAVWIYQGITKVMEEELQPGLVVALLEHEGIGGLSGDKPRPMRGRAGSQDNNLDTPTHLDPKEALDGLLAQLTR